MPLTKQQALELHEAIGKVSFKQKIDSAKQRWESLMKPSPRPIKIESYDNLGQHLVQLGELQSLLIRIRKADLNRKSVEIHFNAQSSFGEKTIRVFDPTRGNFNSDIPDIFARGIDSANAVLEIFKYAFPITQGSQSALQQLTHKDLNQSAVQRLMDLIEHFKADMLIHQQTGGEKGISAAMQEYKKFNASLTALLVELEVVKEQSQAEKAINLIRDFIWKRDLCTAHCSIEKGPENSSYKMLRYAEPMTFGPSEYRLKTNDSRLDFWDETNQDWMKDLVDKLGLTDSLENSWFKGFLKANKETLASLSSTPMSRFTPNPANAFDCTDFIVDDDNNVVQMGHHVRMAITDPLDVKNPEERQKLTEFNHLQLFSKKRLEQEINAFMENWGALFDANAPIPLTILHQTLIGDEVTFSPDQNKAVSGFDGSVINAKQEANEAVRDMIKNSIVLRKKTAPHTIAFLNRFLVKETQDGFQFFKKTPTGQFVLVTYANDEYQRVNINLLETNNCVNMWHARARVRNNDVNDARQLINNAVVLFEKLNETLHNPDLGTIISFLKSSDHSVFTPYKYRGVAVKQAMLQFSNHLKTTVLSTPLNTLNKENLDLSLQAAVELKCTVHETWFGSMRRTLSNFTRDIRDAVPVLGHLIDWTVRTLLWTTALVLTILAFPLNVSSYIKHIADRKEIAKANYEGLLAESIGSLMGGCMSAADRAGEIDEQRAAMRRQFAEEGELLSYNDTPKQKLAFFQRYGSTRTKHDNVEMATGTAVTNDDETRGFNPILYIAKFLVSIKLISPEAVNLMTVGLMSSRVETTEERENNTCMSGLRKGSYDKKIRSSVMYLTSPATVGGEPENPDNSPVRKTKVNNSGYRVAKTERENPDLSQTGEEDSFSPGIG